MIDILHLIFIMKYLTFLVIIHPANLGWFNCYNLIISAECRNIREVSSVLLFTQQTSGDSVVISSLVLSAESSEEFRVCYYSLCKPRVIPLLSFH
jgi:hypothetical protein